VLKWYIFTRRTLHAEMRLYVPHVRESKTSAAHMGPYKCVSCGRQDARGLLTVAPFVFQNEHFGDHTVILPTI
jgi:hypothetical protein